MWACVCLCFCVCTPFAESVRGNVPPPSDPGLGGKSPVTAVYRCGTWEGGRGNVYCDRRGLHHSRRRLHCAGTRDGRVVRGPAATTTRCAQLHESSSFALRLVLHEDMLQLQRGLVARRTINFSRAQAILSSMLLFSIQTRWTELWFVEAFLMRGVYPDGTGLVRPPPPSSPPFPPPPCRD